MKLSKSKQRESPEDRHQANNVAIATATTDPPKVSARAYEGDGQSQPLIVISWIGNVRMAKTLLDGGSIVDSINRRKLLRMKPAPYVHTDDYLRVNLATEIIEILTNYTIVPVNVEGVEADVKAYTADNQVYDMLPGIPWMRRPAFSPHYGLGLVTICEDDGVERQMASEIFPSRIDLPVVEIDSDDDLSSARCR